MEQLEDRVLLSVSQPVPLSNESVQAVKLFLNNEEQFIKYVQVAANKLEADALAKFTKFTTAQVDYFLKIDADMLQIDNDLAGAANGTPATGAAGGINEILTNLALPDKVGKLDATLTKAVESASQDTIAVMGKLQKLQSAAQNVQSSAAVDSFIKVQLREYRDGEDAEMRVFAKNAWPLIEADAKDLGPALGLQGAPAPGPVGALLVDMSALTADSAAVGDINGDGLTDRFVKLSNSFVDAQNIFIKLETAALEKLTLPHEGVLTSGDANYFLKIDADLVQIDNDLAGSAATGATGTAPSGVINTLLNDAGTLQLSQQTVDNLNSLMLAVRKAGGEAAALQNQIQGIFGNQGDGGFLTGPAGRQIGGIAKLIGDGGAGGSGYDASLAKLENGLVQLDPNLGPALGLSTSTTAPGPLGGLLQDSLVLAVDANGNFPGATTYPPPTVVDRFLKLEHSMIQAQNKFVAAEQAFIKLGVQLPQDVVNYFTAVDNDWLKIDSGLLGSSDSTGAVSTSGIDAILAGLSGMPTSYVTRIQALAQQAQSAQQSVLDALKSVQSTSGAITPEATAYIKAHFAHVVDKTQAAFGAIDANFTKIESLLIGLDPNDDAIIQDSKSISDGAAKGQAQD